MSKALSVQSTFCQIRQGRFTDYFMAGESVCSIPALGLRSYSFKSHCCDLSLAEDQVRFTAQGPKPSLFSGDDILHTEVLAQLLRKLLCSALTAEISKFSSSVLEYKSTGTSFQGSEQGKNYWVYTR